MKLTSIQINNTNIGDNIGRYNNREIVGIYLKEISNYKPLSREEEFNVFERIKNENDKTAIDLIIKHNLLFVVAIAKRHGKMLNNSTLTVDDLINEGNLGLMIAVDKFDHKAGFKFISYAVWWIRQSILASINNNLRNIRIPMSAIGILNKIKARAAELEQKLNRDPSINEILETMDEIESTNEKISYHSDLVNISKNETSLNQPLFDGTDEQLINTVTSDQIAPDAMLIENERKRLALDILNEVSEEHKPYLISYFGLFGDTQLTVKEIAIKYKKSTSRVQFIIQSNIRRLRRINNKNKQYFFPTPNYKERVTFGVSDENVTFCI